MSSTRVAAVQVEGHRADPRGRALLILSIGALGVVFGDIGTSPLYALRECFHGPHAIAVVPVNVLGVLSLVFWALIVIISIKYQAYVLRADNRGEGGILALMALSFRASFGPRGRKGIAAIGVVGAALLYGEGVITPAISVLSAVEGLSIATPVFTPFVLPITLVVLIGLFLVQRRGTASVGAVFGPVTFLWFAVLAALGIRGIVDNPGVLLATSPIYAVRFFSENGWHGAAILGSVFLVVTGGEALYADMGHFGRKPIRLAWFVMVLPALVLNYFGQGALLLKDPAAAENPFYLLAPSWGLIPLVILATAATVIASQALISGAFSVTRQAVQLGYCPRFEIIHTSAAEIGQIYIPGVNWALLVGVIALVLGFGSSSRLAAAYGIGVTLVMIMTTTLSFVVSKFIWKWSHWRAVPLTLFILAVELSFFGANILKFVDGGWFPIALAVAIFTLMTTWKRGREVLAGRMRGATFPLELFLQNIGSRPPMRVPGTAVFMTGNPDGTPPALMHNLKHNKVLHERVVLLTLSTLETSYAPPEDRIQVTELSNGFYRVVARYGFMETPNVPELLSQLGTRGLTFKMMDTTFFLGRETLIPSEKPGMALWREALFAGMSRNAQPATAFFGLPPNRVVELGAQIEL